MRSYLSEQINADLSSLSTVLQKIDIEAPVGIHQENSIRYPISIVLEEFAVSEEQCVISLITGGHQESFTLQGNQYRFVLNRPQHKHSYVEIMIVLSGNMMNLIEDETFVYHPGQGCIMNSNIRHKELPIGDARVIFFELQREALNEILLVMEREKSSLSNESLQTFLNNAALADAAAENEKYYIDFTPPVGGNNH